MEPIDTQLGQVANWEYMNGRVGYKEHVMDKTKTVKGSQFAQPLFEFSGACAGCGETPYIKTITQLFGGRQRDGMYFDIQRFCALYALLHQRQGRRARMGQLALRG